MIDIIEDIIYKLIFHIIYSLQRKLGYKKDIICKRF